MKNLLKIICTILILSFSSGLWADDSNTIKTLNERAKLHFMNALAPKPNDIQFFDADFILSKDAKVVFESACEISKKDKELLFADFKRSWNILPNIEFINSTALNELAEEAYNVDINSNRILISARDINGLRHAMKTLRQLSEVERGTKNYVLPFVKIKDAPALKFRGIHMCIFPETTLVEIEKFIRISAYYKFNYIIIEFWGTYPFEKNKFLSFPDKMMDKKELRRLIDLAWHLGITPIPHFQILGHVTGSLNGSSKHAILPNNPELAELFEPQAWTWCISNPKTMPIIKEAIAEIHEFFGNPPFIHTGCDEAHGLMTCYKCRRLDLHDTMKNHLVEVNSYINSRGARMMMWHDMLVVKGDKKWDGYSTWGDPATDPEKLAKDLPKNIVICDWEYSEKYKDMTDFKMHKHFKDLKYDTLVSPCANKTGMRALARKAKEDKIYGYLQTTWGFPYRYQGRTMWYTSSSAAWCNEDNFDGGWVQSCSTFGKHIVDIEKDSNFTKYEDLGVNQKQTAEFLHRN